MNKAQNRFPGRDWSQFNVLLFAHYQSAQTVTIVEGRPGESGGQFGCCHGFETGPRAKK
jgi:hypothetical protein